MNNVDKYADFISSNEDSTNFRVLEEDTVSEAKEEHILEGVWATPDTPKKKAELKRLLSKPLLAKDATDKLYSILGADDLFDDIDRVKNKDQDVRDIVRNYIADNKGIDEDFDRDFYGEVLAEELDALGLSFDHLAEMNEGQLDELSKKTLSSYIDKAKDDADDYDGVARDARTMANDIKSGQLKRDPKKYANKEADIADWKDEDKWATRKAKMRRAGVNKAVRNLTKEEYDEIVAHACNESFGEDTSAFFNEVLESFDTYDNIVEALEYFEANKDNEIDDYS